MIKIRTLFKTALTPIIAILFSHATHAATDSAAIELTHTYTPYVTFTGSAPGASRFFDNDDVVNWIYPLTVSLGTMGLESNIGGDCELEFTTVNDFELKHTIIPTNGGDFTIIYQGQNFTKGNSPILTTPCTTAATDISFKLNFNTIIGFDNRIPSGIFQDTLTVVVTTQ